ncbi:MAG: hypothetical protein AMS19_01895 [Gemmatimonas sp. SG8_23]|nr:MAG: hypothetical protein AMS19_01895 [Gemmatimonas sp. SG8_23]
MKRRLLVLVGLFAFAVPASIEAQPAALSLWGGWKWGGSMSVREGRLNAAASEHFGAELAIRVRQDGLGVLYVDYQPSTLRIDRYGEPNRELYDMDVWYFMGGGTGELIGQGRAVPYATFLIGAAWFNPRGTAAEGIGSETMFASIIGAGVRLPLGQDDRVQIRLDGRMHLTIPYGGVGMWCGSGGCSGTFGGTVGPVQGSVSAGLRLALGDTPPRRSGAPRRR